MAIYTPTPQALGATVARAADGEAASGAIIGGEVEPAYDAIARLQQLVNPGEGAEGTIDIVRALPDVGTPRLRCAPNGGQMVSTTAPVDVSTRCFFEYEVDLPDGCTLQSLTLYVNGENSGTGAPNSSGEPITWQLAYRTLTTGARTDVTAEILDPSNDEAEFEAHHAIAETDINHVISRQNRRYFVAVAGEWAAGRQAGTAYIGLVAAYSVDAIDVGR